MLSDSPKLLPKKAPPDQMLLEQKPEEASDGSHEGTAIPPFPHFCVFPYNSAKVSLSTPVLVAVMSSVSVSISSPSGDFNHPQKSHQIFSPIPQLSHI